MVKKESEVLQNAGQKILSVTVISVLIKFKRIDWNDITIQERNDSGRRTDYEKIKRYKIKDDDL